MKHFCLLVFGAALISCGPPTHKAFRESEILNPPQKVIESVSFNELYLRVLEPKCIGCHGASGNVNLGNIEGARKFLGKIRQAVLIDQKMPKAPYAALSFEELQMVSAWIKAGAPASPKNGDAAPSIPPLESTFASIRDRIIIPKCVACHRAGGTSPRILLDSVSEMVNSPLEVVIPGKPDESGLILVVQSNARKKMPPSESGIGPLKLEEIDVIIAWIASGAP